MKILKSEEFIKESLVAKKYVFAFKDVSANADDRDCVSYVEINNGKIYTDISGQIIITGPNYSSRLDKDANRKDYETVLTEEQFNAFKEDNCPEEMLESISAALLSKENETLTQKVKNDELDTIANMCGISKQDAWFVVDNYPLSNEYFDRGICSSSSYENIGELIEMLVDEDENKNWLVEFLKDNTDNEEIEEYLENVGEYGSRISYDKLVELGYDFDAIDVTDLRDEYIELNNGKVIEYYI